MRYQQSKAARPAVSRMSIMALLGLSVLAMMGCSSPSGDDGIVIDTIVLPSDTLLNLACPNVGIAGENCIETDPENPFRTTTIREFDVMDPDAETKFDLAAMIPAGPSGAKARFYLWATALARRQNGENQYFTALALHELFTVNADPVVRDQALRAYRAVWDNFFGSVVFFTCCGEFFPFPRPDPSFAVPLNELVLERLVRAAEFPGPGDPFYPTGFAPLIPDDPTGLDAGLIELETQEVIGGWGFNYRCTGSGDSRFCVVSVSVFDFG